LLNAGFHSEQRRIRLNVFITGVRDRKRLFIIEFYSTLIKYSHDYSVYSKYERLTVNRCLIRYNAPFIWKSVYLFLL
jgi:hypothetical protein